jgi:hypothetical protein
MTKNKNSILYARTYGSVIHNTDPQNAWKFPTGPLIDRFGIPIGLKTFGLEEFNFSDFYRNQKWAYIPCYGSERSYPRPFVSELRLMYRILSQTKFCYKHYATLYNVKSFTNDEIDGIRNIIDPQLNQIYFREESNLYFGNNYPEYQLTIQEMLASNLIANNNNNRSFSVNVQYDDIEILKNPVICQCGGSYASNWYRRVQHNCYCN